MNDPRIIRFDVLECFAAFIEYGDSDYLSEFESRCIAGMLERETADLVPGSYHWTIESDEESGVPFGMCYATGAKGSLCTVALVYDGLKNAQEVTP